MIQINTGLIRYMITFQMKTENYNYIKVAHGQNKQVQKYRIWKTKVVQVYKYFYIL